MSTAHEHMAISREMLAEDPDEFAQRLLIERDDEIVAAVYGIPPDAVRAAVLTMLAAFRAQAAVYISDTWIYTGKMDDADLPSAREMFRAGDPGASEALMVIHTTAEAKVLLTQPYVRTGDEVVFTEWEGFPNAEEFSGRLSVDVQLAAAAIAKGQEVAQTLKVATTISEREADMAAARAVGALFPDLEILLLIPFESDIDATLFTVEAAAAGLHLVHRSDPTDG